MVAIHRASPATRGDLRNPDLTVAHVMRTDFRSCNASTPIAEVAAAMQQSRCGFLAVTRAQIPLGIVTEHGLATALVKYGGDLSRVTAEALMTEATTIPRDALTEQVVDRLAAAGGRLLAVNADGLLQGVVTLAELGPQLAEAALGRLVARLSDENAMTGAHELGNGQTHPRQALSPAEAARAADPTAEIKDSKSQTQPHPWDSPTGAHPEPIPLVSRSDLVNPLLVVADAMTANPRTCSPASSALEAVLIFRDADCGLIPVTDGGRPVGVLTDRDVALALADHASDLATTPVEQLMTTDVVTIATDATLDAAIESLSSHGLHRLLVVDSDGRLAGVLSWTALVPHLSERGIGHAVSRLVDNR